MNRHHERTKITFLYTFKKLLEMFIYDCKTHLKPFQMGYQNSNKLCKKTQY